MGNRPGRLCCITPTNQRLTSNSVQFHIAGTERGWFFHHLGTARSRPAFSAESADSTRSDHSKSWIDSMAEALPEPAINTRDRTDGALSSSRRLCVDRQFRSGRPNAISSSHRPPLRTSDIEATGCYPVNGVPWG